MHELSFSEFCWWRNSIRFSPSKMFVRVFAVTGGSPFIPSIGLPLKKQPTFLDPNIKMSIATNQFIKWICYCCLRSVSTVGKMPYATCGSYEVWLSEALSSAEVSFVFPKDRGMGRGEIKRAGAGEKGKGSALGTFSSSPARPRFFTFPVFSLFFPVLSPFYHWRSLCGGESCRRSCNLPNQISITCCMVPYFHSNHGACSTRKRTGSWQRFISQWSG